MKHLSLALGGQGGGPHVGEAAVHVPLHIGDVRAGQNGLDLSIDAAPHLRAGEVQHQLIAAPGGDPAGDAQRPVGVFPVEIAVLADHLRLDPDAEGHAQLLQPGDQGLQPAGQLAVVHHPVPQAAVVVVPLAEPAVVHDEQLDAQRGGGFGDVRQLFGVKAEVGGLPVVDEHRAAGAPEGVLDQVLPDGPVELAAHLPQAAGGADQRRLRGGEGGVWLQGPAELVGVDAHHQPDVVILAGLRLGLEIAAVQQHGPVAQAVVLVGLPVAEDHKGVVLVAGGPTDAAHPLDAGTQRGAAGGPLHHVAAVKGDQVQIGALEVQTQGGALAQADGRASAVAYLDRAGNQVAVLKHAIGQLHRQIGGRVLQGDPEGFRPLRSAEKGQAVQLILTPLHLPAGQAQIGHTAAVRIFDLNGGQAEIPHAAGGVLLGEGVQGVGAVRPGLMGIGRAGPVGIADQIGQVAVPDPGAVVGVNQNIVPVGLHLISGVFGVQGKDPVFLVDHDHEGYPLNKDFLG